MDLFTVAAWAAIGQFVIAFMAFGYQLWTDPKVKPDQRLLIKRLGAIIFCSVTLVLPGLAIYWLSIRLATLEPGTTIDLVIKTAGWGVFLGITIGITWFGLLFPILVKWIKSIR